MFGAKAEFAKTDTMTDTNDYDLTFDLEINYINETSDNLLWALYMVEGDGLEADLDPDCKLVSDVVGNETHYWYNDTGTKDEEEDETPTSCTLSSSQKETLQSTTMIGYGYLKANQSQNAVINKETATQTGNPSGTTVGNVTAELYNTGDETNNPLKGRTLNTEDTKSKYYYLVVQYPNENSKQNEDEGSKTINVSLKVSTGSAAATLRKKA